MAAVGKLGQVLATGAKPQPASRLKVHLTDQWDFKIIRTFVLFPDLSTLGHGGLA
jgi:hypothetical protein